MKVGILTLPLRINFGGILQAYAMQEILKKMGHESVLLDSSPFVSLPAKSRYLIYLKRAIQKYILRKKFSIRIDQKINKDFSYISQHTIAFINRNITKEERKKDFSDVKAEEFNAFIVGSDQIWRPKYFHTHIKHAYLAFAKEWNIKRIAYAASFGTDEWEYTPEETTKCSTLAKMFDAISVREASAVKICKERLGVEATHLLDPTMLLTAEEYIKLFQEAKTPKSKGDLMCYILDRNEDTKQIINLISSQKGLTAFHTNSRVEDDNAPIEERVQPAVEEWLRGFYDAKLVITDSFHACVFSILFNKPFIVYGNKERGMTRFNSLLSIFNLQERLVATPQEAQEIINKAIDWKNVNDTLDKWREKSNNFLRAHL